MAIRQPGGGARRCKCHPLLPILSTGKEHFVRKRQRRDVALVAARDPTSSRISCRDSNGAPALALGPINRKDRSGLRRHTAVI